MILLRHGQSEFNVHMAATRRDPGIVDPRLTEYGHYQATLAAERLAGEPIRRIIAGLPSHCRRRGTARNTNCKSIFLPTAS